MERKDTNVPEDVPTELGWKDFEDYQRNRENEEEVTPYSCSDLKDPDELSEEDSETFYDDGVRLPSEKEKIQIVSFFKPEGPTNVEYLRYVFGEGQEYLKIRPQN